MSAKIDQLIINSPYQEPQAHWRYERETRSFTKEPGRRPAGYVVATEGSKSFDDPGEFRPLPLVNQIRPRVKSWRDAGYPGVTGITKRLLEHWYDAEQREGRRFFFCQLEAIETLIWLAEAPAAERQGIEIPGDGGPFKRVCSKMATGAGKTIVMAKLIAWHILNKVTNPQDRRFSKHVLVNAPGLTVKSRLQVLVPDTDRNYYDEFSVVPHGLMEKLRLGKVLVRNWHALNWETEEQLAKKKRVDKRGAKSDEAYVREVLQDIASARSILVINDEPEYVNIFGVPFTFLPHEGGDGPPPPPAPPKTRIEPLPEKRKFEISWPNIVRIDHVYQPRLELNMAQVKPLELDAGDTATQAELAPYLEGKPDVRHLSEIELESLARKFRMQKIIFEAARDVFDQMKPSWKGSQEFLLAQLIGLIERFIQAGRIVISPPVFDQDDLRRRLILTLNMNKLVQHIWEQIRFENSQALTPVFDTEKPLRSTGDMRPWYSGKPCERTKKSHINFCVFDSTWEASEAFELDRNRNVAAWVKNDHLGFEILYVFRGVVHKFRPDFLVRLTGELTLILEIKGQDTQQDQTKREFLDEWVRAVNEHGGFGRWAWAVSRHPGDVKQILETHSRSN